MSRFNDRLTELMHERKMTPTQLAEKSGTQLCAVYTYLNGYGTLDICNPRAKTLERLADALGVPMDYLWGKSDKR